MTKPKAVKSSAIARFLGAKLFGKDLVIEGAAPIHALRPGCLSFVKKFDEAMVGAINENPDVLIIGPEPYKDRIRCSYLISDNPRLDFLRVIREFFAPAAAPEVHETAIIHPKAKLGKNVSVGAHTLIGPEVTIGDGTRIDHHVVFQGKVTMGKAGVVKSNAVIGGEGFGFEYNEYGVPEHFPHIGSIEIGDNVWIGACSTIERATLHKTVIGPNVKIDDLVQVGHNTQIGANTLVMAGSIICGGAAIGRNCWIAPNTTIKEKLKLSDNVTTGLGSVVINDVPANTVVAGNPARKLRRRI